MRRKLKEQDEILLSATMKLADDVVKQVGTNLKKGTMVASFDDLCNFLRAVAALNTSLARTLDAEREALVDRKWSMALLAKRSDEELLALAQEGEEN